MAMSVRMLGSFFVFIVPGFSSKSCFDNKFEIWVAKLNITVTEQCFMPCPPRAKEECDTEDMVECQLEGSTPENGCKFGQFCCATACNGTRCRSKQLWLILFYL